MLFVSVLLFCVLGSGNGKRLCLTQEEKLAAVEKSLKDVTMKGLHRGVSLCVFDRILNHKLQEDGILSVTGTSRVDCMEPDELVRHLEYCVDKEVKDEAGSVLEARLSFVERQSICSNSSSSFCCLRIGEEVYADERCFQTFCPGMTLRCPVSRA